MPFQDGVYYPYPSDTQGNHSSAGIPSLLNSPLSQQSVNGHSAPGMMPSSGASTVLPFKFRPRRESVDWRRINAVDIDLVVSQLDVDALQEHISSVTFCSLDGERCQRCQSPVDPALVKLLRLAQLSVEWLLHCQEFLSFNLRTAEERLVAAGREREQLLAQQKKQEEKMKMLTTELKQRKKVIRTQQSLLTPRIISSHKCQHCEKSFLNSGFLQSHMQRRHPDEYEIQLRSDTDKKVQTDSLKSEVSSLKEQIVQLQHALQTKTAQEKEQQSMHKDVLRELDRFKAEEMARMDRKIEDSRDGMRREMEFLYSRNIQALNEANQYSKQEKPPSPVQSQPERDLDNYKEMQSQAIRKLEQQLKKQDKKWESRMQEIESEKNQLLNDLSRMQLLVSEHQEHSQKLQQEMGRKLQEKEQTIRAQRDQIRNISSNPPTRIVETPVILSTPEPEPKPKRVVLESSSVSERRPVEKKPDPGLGKKQRATINVLRRNPNMKKEIRQELEKSVLNKLENLGVKPDQVGLKDKELSTILSKMHSKRQSNEYWLQREEISNTVDGKLETLSRGSDPALGSQTKTKHSFKVSQIRPRSSSLPSRATQIMSGPTVKQPKTPQPAPRTRTTTQPKTSTPNTKTVQRNFTPKTSPFSSDEEETEDDDTDMEAEEQPPRHHQNQRGKVPQLRLNQAAPVQIKATKSSPVLAKQTAVRNQFISSSQGSRGLTGGAMKTAVTKLDSDDEDKEDWSEISELQEIDPKQLQSFKDQNGNVDKRSFGKEKSVKKPAGGVSVFPERKDEIQELTYTDLEESSEWVVSSLEDKQEKPFQGSGPAKKSHDSPSTSVWGTSTGKGSKSGLTEAGTGSTLKSSLFTFSDISDSEDISNKHN
ncbi:cilium assembly protein DZIP1 isoform X2 [Sphaeramia orbicularis]|nr:zinc finger protein Dzip1-like isoform X2 [Sphaeramia orbicularis]